MSAVPHDVFISSYPEPKEFVVAAEVEFSAAQTGGGTLNPQPLGTFKRYPGMERNHHSRYIDGGVFGGEVPNGLAVFVDTLGNLFECRYRSGRPRQRRSLSAIKVTEQVAACQAKADQQCR